MEHLNREEIVELLYHAKAGREGDWVLFLVTFWHGLRASEAVALTLAEFRDGFLDVQRLKGSMRTIQPLMEDSDELLNEKAAVEGWIAKHRQLHDGDGLGKLLFPLSRFAFYRRMRSYGRLAGLPEHLCHPHVLKHSIAMQSIRQAGIENVRQYLGHKSIASTGAYLRVSDSAASRAVAAAMGTDNPAAIRTPPAGVRKAR